MDMLINLLLGLVLTALAYLAFPVIRLIINHGKFEKARAKKIALWNSIILGAFFCITTAAVSDNGATWSAGPAFLYYWINCALLTKRKDDQDGILNTLEKVNVTPEASSLGVEINRPSQISDPNAVHKTYGDFNIYGSDIRLASSEQHTDNYSSTESESYECPSDKEVVESIKLNNVQVNQNYASSEQKIVEKGKFCSRCGGKIDNTTKQCTGCGKQYFKGFKLSGVLCVILAVLLTFSCIMNIGLYKKVSELDTSDEIQNLQNELNTLNSNHTKLAQENTNLKREIADLQGELDVCYMEIDFIDEFVVFIEDDRTDLYHKYQCSKFVGEYFWAFNVDAALERGALPCPLCCGE